MEPMQDNEGRTPFEDLTNNINGGGLTTSNSRTQVDERAKRQREIEKARYAAMTQEERDERNKIQGEKYHQRKAETVASGSRGVGVESNKENMDATKLRSEREKARLAAMTQEERNEKNRKCREQYNKKKAVGVESTTENKGGNGDSDWLHRNNSYEPMDIDNDNICTILDEYSDRCVDQSGMVDLTDASPDLNLGTIIASGSIDETVTCPKEHKRELERAGREAMSPEQKALLNKRRRDLYAQKNAARNLQMTPQDKEVKRKEMKKNYNRMVREHRANTLHPDSIAMESPHFNPQIIFSPSLESPKATSLDMEIPEFGGTPIYIAPAIVENPEVENPEFDVAHTIHRHRVTSGERNALMSRRNQAFEANIGRNARGCANGECDDANDLTHPSMVCNDGVTQETSVPPPINCTGTQTQLSVVDGASPMPQNGAQAVVDDVYDVDVIFDVDEEEDAYFFTRQEYDEHGNEVEHSDNTDEQENSEPDIPDPFDRVYANLPSESHMLPSVPNCKHCNAKKFEGEPPGFCCRGGKIRLSNPDTPPELMRLWTSSDADARHFRANIRYFNGHFSFTSLYYHLDRVTTNMKIYGVYMFHTHGQIYHNL